MTSNASRQSEDEVHTPPTAIRAARICQTKAIDLLDPTDGQRDVTNKDQGYNRAYSQMEGQGDDHRDISWIDVMTVDLHARSLSIVSLQATVFKTVQISLLVVLIGNCFAGN